jgi:hypothetical protein|nr:MAG TPA: hypothetical protein [Caudoviricetes sp.]
MSDSAVDKAVFAFLASCVGDFVEWPQCSIVTLRGRNEGGRLSGVLFKAMAVNPVDRTVFRIRVTKNDEWRVRIIQVSNHIRLDGVDADRDLIVHAMNRFMELAGMVEAEES